MDKPRKQIRWAWIQHDGQTLRSIGIAADGTLINPNGYSEELVRAATAGALERRRERHRAAAAKAAATRVRRRALQVDKIAQSIIDGHQIGPRMHCADCGRKLTDPESIKLGVGTECWDGLLSVIEQMRAAQKGAA